MKAQNCPVCRPKLLHGKSSWVPVGQVTFMWNEQRLEWQFFPSTVLLLQEIMSIMKKLLWFHHEPNTILQPLLLAMGWFCFRFSILRMNGMWGQYYLRTAQIPTSCSSSSSLVFKDKTSSIQSFPLILSKLFYLGSTQKKQETLII